MSGEVAPWNLLQIALIAVYPAWMSFTRMPTGMSLLAVYVFLLLLAIPPIFIQLKLGGHQQRGIVALLSKHFPIFKGLGITLLTQLFLTCVYLVPLVTHYGLYAYIAVSQQPYVWGDCGNEWNDKQQCYEKSPQINALPGGPYDVKSIGKESPESQFFTTEYLQLSDNITDVRGFPLWSFNSSVKDFGVSILPLAMVITWLLIFFSIAFGARICGWILFILGPSFLALIFTVLGYGYSNLDSNGTDTFLHHQYTLDMEQFSHIEHETPIVGDWKNGFVLLMFSLPIWTAVFPTMGKMTGSGRLSRNVSWLIVILVYAATCQLPQLSMAPYIGNLHAVVTDKHVYNSTGFDVVFKTMAGAFAILEIPPSYAMLFYLVLFIGGLMFLIVSMFSILDNLVDALMGWVDTFQDRRGCVTFCAAFALISIGVGASVLHTTQAGLYFIILMDKCVHKLLFLTVALHGIAIVIIYAKQNFGIAERVIMGAWCMLSTVTTSALFLYVFVSEMDSTISYGSWRMSGTWDLVCWIFASTPFLAVPAAAIHSFQREEGSMKRKLRYLFCGTKVDRCDPPQEYGYHRPEPSAPPYGPGDTYAYVEDEGYAMNEVPYNKINEREMSPLDSGRI